MSDAAQNLEAAGRIPDYIRHDIEIYLDKLKENPAYSPERISQIRGDVQGIISSDQSDKDRSMELKRIYADLQRDYLNMTTTRRASAVSAKEAAELAVKAEGLGVVRLKNLGITRNLYRELVANVDELGTVTGEQLIQYGVALPGEDAEAALLKLKSARYFTSPEMRAYMERTDLSQADVEDIISRSEIYKSYASYIRYVIGKRNNPKPLEAPPPLAVAPRQSARELLPIEAARQAYEKVFNELEVVARLFLGIEDFHKRVAERDSTRGNALEEIFTDQKNQALMMRAGLREYDVRRIAAAATFLGQRRLMSKEDFLKTDIPTWEQYYNIVHETLEKLRKKAPTE